MKKLKYMALTLFVSLASLPLYAQARDMSSYTGAWKSNLRILKDDVIDIVLYSSCILGLLFIILAFIQHNTGDRDAAKSWFKLAGGLLMVFLITQVIKMILP